MARKSRWQQFSDNFNSVYDTFNKAAQNIETSRIMDDEKFTSGDGLGAGLEGSALEKARYKALGDIYTKYGNAEQGLAMRNQLATLDAAERENTINQTIMQELIDQRGALQSGLMPQTVVASLSTETPRGRTALKAWAWRMTGLASRTRTLNWLTTLVWRLSAPTLILRMPARDWLSLTPTPLRPAQKTPPPRRLVTKTRLTAQMRWSLRKTLWVSTPLSPHWRTLRRKT
jgi:hypothetical protein